jgi:hypothetical protein
MEILILILLPLPQVNNYLDWRSTYNDSGTTTITRQGGIIGLLSSRNKEENKLKPSVNTDGFFYLAPWKRTSNIWD